MVGWRGWWSSGETKGLVTGAPPYGVAESEVPASFEGMRWWENWVRPEGPAKVALQVGHWRNSEFPEELAKLRNNGGASGGGKMEWEVNLEVAETTKRELEKVGVDVEILPATVPARYWADVFVAIHADGSESAGTRGFKFAGPWRDLTGNSKRLVKILEANYQEATGMPIDENVTRNMRGYYAFAWWRYEHAVHPMTTAVIAETGFLTSPVDRKIIVEQPEVVAQGLAEGIVEYLSEQGLMEW